MLYDVKRNNLQISITKRLTLSPAMLLFEAGKPTERMMQNLYQQTHTRIATSYGPTRKPAEAMVEAGKRRRRIERPLHSNKLRELVSASADIDELERMIDELEE